MGPFQSRGEGKMCAVAEKPAFRGGGGWSGCGRGSETLEYITLK